MHSKHVGRQTVQFDDPPSVIASAAIGSGIPGFRVAAPVILLISALLTGGYLLTVVVDGFFPGESGSKVPAKKADPSFIMWLPLTFLCATTLVMGLFGPSILKTFGL